MTDTMHIYCARLGFEDLDSARQSKIEAKRSERRSPAPSGQGEEEDQFDEVVASPNLQNLAARSIPDSVVDLDFQRRHRGPSLNNPLSIIYLLLSFFMFVSCPLSGYELCVSSMFRDESPYLKEWIEYHRMVGVDHFYLYADFRCKDDWKSILQPYIDEGLVEVQEVFVPGGELAMYIAQQCDSNKESLVKCQLDHTTWLAFIDIDEFILPLRGKSVVDCLNEHFKDSDAIYVSWLNFGTSGVDILPGDSVLFNLTQCSQKGHPKNGSGKTIVRPNKAKTENFWSPHYCQLIEGAQYVDGNRNPLVTEGLSLKISGKCCDHFLRINHYPFRGENFFLNNRLMKARNSAGEYSEALLWEQYHSFSLVKDTKIISFIKRYYPETHRSLWGLYSK